MVRTKEKWISRLLEFIVKMTSHVYIQFSACLGTHFENKCWENIFLMHFGKIHCQNKKKWLFQNPWF